MLSHLLTGFIDIYRIHMEFVHTVFYFIENNTNKRIIWNMKKARGMCQAVKFL